MHIRLISGSLSLALLLSVVAAGADPSIQVGVGKTEITPREPMPLWGYSSRTDPFAAVYDPLYCRTIVFDDGKTKAAIVSLDLGRTPPGHWVDTLRTRARDVFGIDQLLLAATHTHAAPNMGSNHAPIPWIESVAAQIYRSFEIAEANMQAAHFKVGQGAVDITYDRRVVNDDGSITMLWQNHQREHTKPVDQRIKVVQINNQAEQPIATLVHYACHPVICGNKNMGVTADIPGAISSYVGKHVGGECLFLQGACGEINPYLAGLLQGDRATYPQLVAEAEKAAKEIVDIVKGSQPVAAEDYTIRYQDASVRFGFRHPVSDERISGMLKGYYRVNELKEISRSDYQVEAPLSILTLGNTFAWAGFPGEFFDDFQIDLAERSPVENTYFVGYCNGYYSYFPTIEAAAEGGYGASWGLIAAAGTGERFVDQAIIALYQLMGQL